MKPGARSLSVDNACVGQRRNHSSRRNRRANRLLCVHRTLQTSRTGPPFSNCSSCSRMALSCSCWFASNRWVPIVRKIKSAAATRLYGFDLSSSSTPISISAMRGVASTIRAVAPASVSRTISFKVSRTTLSFRHSLNEEMAMPPSSALAFQLLPAARASNANKTGEGSRLCPRPLHAEDGLQRACQSFAVITTTIGCDLFWRQRLSSHTLKQTHLLPLRCLLHALLINSSRMNDLVSHPLILLRLTKSLALLRLQLKPSRTQSTCIARLQLSLVQTDRHIGRQAHLIPASKHRCVQLRSSRSHLVA